MFSYILFISELVNWCWENDIPVGYSRGSVAGSLSAYILNITDVDPVIWDTIFSRFVNEDRISLADVDLDFAPSDRQRVYDYIINRFGIEMTSYITTFNSISDKGTISEITRALNYDFQTSMSIKKEFEEDEATCRNKYSDVFYYFDGLIDTYISVGIHPAGMIGSPVNIVDNIGIFSSDGKYVSQCDMKAVDSLNYVKFDILGLKNIGIIKETYKILGIDYLKSHQIDWSSEDVWNDTITSPAGLFQFESSYAFSLLKKFKPQQINDMSLVNASLRPSGASYRDRLLSREFNKNPTKEIDELLKNNLGYLVFQEDQTKFLQEICGFTGGEADSVRRAIGKKLPEELKLIMPKIKEGYISNSKQSRGVAEKEVEEFLQILMDSADYAFGYNHSTGYSMIGYTCAYLRCHHPLEFTTAFLRMSDTEDDFAMGMELAKLKNIKVNPVTFGKSKDFFDIKDGHIYKGMKSVKYINDKIPLELNELYSKNLTFPELISELKDTSVNSRQLDTLIKIDYFKQYGSIGRLLTFVEYINNLKKKTYKQEGIDEQLEYFIKDFSELSVSKTGVATYKNLDKESILNKIWEELDYNEISDLDKIKYQLEFLGYVEDIPKDVSLAKVEMVSNKNRSANLKSYRNGESKWFRFKKDEVSLPSKGDIIIIYGMYKQKGWKSGLDWYVKKYSKI
jgi:DNA polymerase-3 subunit alpha